MRGARGSGARGLRSASGRGAASAGCVGPSRHGRSEGAAGARQGHGARDLGARAGHRLCTWCTRPIFGDV